MIKQHWWVLGMALLVGVGGILYGYDIGVVSGALLFIHSVIPLSQGQEGLIVAAVLWGGLVGTMVTGPMADYWGRRGMILLACGVFVAGVLSVVQATTFVTLLCSRLLLGVGVGIVSVAVPLYVTELVPASHRGRYVSFFQLFLTLGILLAYWVDSYFAPSGNWRAMFLVLLIPTALLLVGMLRLPESPRWLMAHGYPERARQVLRRTHVLAEVESEMLAIKESLHETNGRWRDLFSRPMWLPLFLAVSVAIFNQFTGINTFLQFAPSLLKGSGLGSNVVVIHEASYIAILNVLATLVALLLVDRVGRRPLLLTGIAGVVVFELLLAAVHYFPFAPIERGWLTLFFMMGFIVFFAIGPGVVVWLVISELFPTQLRGRGIAICLFFSSLSGASLASSFIAIAARFHWSGAYLFCAGCSIVYFLVVYGLLPETKACTLEKIQRYFYQDAAVGQRVGGVMKEVR